MNDARILLVADHADFLVLLKLMVHSIGFKRVDTARDFESAFRLFTTEAPDICLFDIDLGLGKNGIELAEAIRDLDPYIPIIFLTADYTEEQYERCLHTRPSSFMNNELSKLKLSQAIELALLQSENRIDASASGTNPLSVAKVHPSPDRYFFKIGEVYKSISVANIAYFFSDQRFCSARVDRSSYPTTVQLKVLEEELYPRFVRSHKSYLVNINFITAIHPRKSILEVAGETLPVGNTYRKSFMDSIRLIR